MTVADCRWIMRVSDISQPRLKYEEVIYDGINCIATTVFDTGGMDRSKFKNDAAAIVSLGPVPEPNLPNVAGYLWLAFGSGCVFGEREDGRCHPVWGLSDEVRGTKYHPPARYAVVDAFPRVPERVDYYVDDSVDFFSPSLKQDLADIVSRNLPPAISKERLWATYRVSDFYEEPGFKVPKSFEMAVFNSVLPSAPPTASAKLSYRVTGKVDTFISGYSEKDDSILRLPDHWIAPKDLRVTVDDYRGAADSPRGLIPIQYGMSNDYILDTNSAKFKVLEVRSRAAARRGPPQAPSHFPVRLFLLGTLVTFAVLIAIFARRLRNIKENQQTNQ